VQVPAARGRVIPDIDSIKDDLPALCEPMTAIMGKSISAPTLHENENRSRHWDTRRGLPGGSHAVNNFQNPPTTRALVGVGQTDPAGQSAEPSPIIDDTSGVVAKEPIDETEDVLLL